MPPILDKPIKWRRSDTRPSPRNELTPEEQANVCKALGVLRVRLGSNDKLAKAMRVTKSRLTWWTSKIGHPGAVAALYASRLAGVSVEDVLTGRFPVEGACPMCGRVTEAP